MKYLKSDEWYPWRRHSDKIYPWERYLNTDFLKSERKRINEDERFGNIRYNATVESDRIMGFILKNILRELRIATA